MNRKTSIVSAVGLVVGLIALALVCVVLANTPTSSQSSQQLGGVYAVNNVAPAFTGGIDMGPLPVHENWQGGKIAAKSNTAFWKNTSGRTRYVDYVEVSTDGTASSTYKIYAYASTSAPRGIFDITSNPANTGGTLIAINAFSFGTSTVATTTTNVDKALNGHTVQVPDQSYLDILVKNSDTGCGSQGSGVCETSTSTNRGFNLQWRIHYHE